MKTADPEFRYYISGLPSHLEENSPLYLLPLMGKDAEGITLRDYFTAAEKFIRRENFHPLKRAMESILHKSLESIEIGRINIHLEKHGLFYHPAKIEIIIENETNPLLLALNTAVSAPGLALIKRESAILEYLGEFDSDNYLPVTFDFAIMECEKQQIGFFLAEWFDGYREFHITDQTVNGHYLMSMWNSDGSTEEVPYPEYLEIYEKTSELISSFYNPATSDQIGLWHNAAGDFIAKRIENSFSVKLITVRDYSPVADVEEDGTPGTEDILKAMLLFFMNLALRMRLDRFDGTADFCMVDREVIPFIVKGFMKAMANKNETLETFFPEESDSISSICSAFISYAGSFNAQSLKQIYTVIIDQSEFSEAERAFIFKNLEEHSEQLAGSIGNSI